MKKLFIILFGIALFLSSCQKNTELKKPNENVIVISEDLSVENGILTFKSKESYNKILELLVKDSKNFAKLSNLIYSSGFEPIGKIYSNMDKKVINSMLETNVIPEDLKMYFKIIPLDNKEFELVETVSSTWLKLILNKNFTFAIGEGLLTIDDENLIFVDKFKAKNSVKLTYKLENLSESKNVRKTLFSSNDWDYSWDGRNYRLKIKENASSGTYLPTWGFRVFTGLTEIELKHQRRTLFTWWQYDIDQMSIQTSGNSWGPNPQNPSGEWCFCERNSYTGNVLNTSCIGDYWAPAVRWFTSTGTGKCTDGVTRSISITDNAS